METIVSIDFDVIMWKSIELYNNFIEGNIDEMAKIEEDIPLLKYANADLELYAKLTSYLLELTKHNTQFIFIDSHEEVLNYLTTPCKLINIDHHHDLGYSPHHWGVEEILCGNWVYWGIKKKLINTYIWLHGFMETPITIADEYKKELTIPIIESNIIEMDMSHFSIPSKVIICASYSWIPTAIRPLYTIWKELFKEKNKND